METEDFDVKKALEEFWESKDGKNILSMIALPDGTLGELPYSVVSPRFAFHAVELAFTAGRLKGRIECAGE